MTYRFSQRSEEHLKHLVPEMVRVVRRALSFQVMDFTVLETLRDEERQRLLIEAGTSQKADSLHLANDDGLAEAVDLLPYPYNVNGVDVWQDKQRFSLLAGLIFAAAAIENVPVRWGGDWDGDGNNADSKFHDMPHFELRR
ncbi:MAG: M15 family peptidase [Proteobacteria bacterium]|nr:M15 family peptidase [Pseudomonadota bacterium]